MPGAHVGHSQGQSHGGNLSIYFYALYRAKIQLPNILNIEG